MLLFDMNYAKIYSLLNILEREGMKRAKKKNRKPVKRDDFIFEICTQAILIEFLFFSLLISLISFDVVRK